MKLNLKSIQDQIQYQFKNEDILYSAIMHSSYANEHHLPKHLCNERLEFLGDAVLELVTSEYLFEQDKEMPEGQLTRLRASIVCEPSLAFCAKEMKLGTFLLMGKGEETTGGRNRDSITSDAFEAIIGAIYLDGGFASAKEFIFRFVLNDLEHKKLFFDSKTILQEMVQAHGTKEIQYNVIKEEGPDHDKCFTVSVMLNDAEYGIGTGKTKKAAEQQAAYHAILKLREE